MIFPRSKVKTAYSDLLLCFVVLESDLSFLLTQSMFARGFILVAGRWRATAHSRAHGPTEQADTSIWKVKAHLQEAKERATEITTQSSLISSPTHQPVTSLHPYGRDIPQALQDLSPLLPDAPATTDGDQVQASPTSPPEEPTGAAETAAQDPVPGQAEHHQQEPQANQPPIVITPTGYTRTSRQVRHPAQFAYAAYHCKHLAQTGIQSVFDFHPFASLRAFASTIAQPDGYSDAMPLNMALQQPDHDKFIDAMARELEQHTELKHWKIIHKSQVLKNAKPIPMVWTL